VTARVVYLFDQDRDGLTADLAERRTVTFGVVEWSLVLARLERDEVLAVRELAAIMRDQLSHPCSAADDCPPHGMPRPEPDGTQP
jgi:hypothetical protein